MAFLDQLPNGLVQTAAREHQKVKWSPTDKHPNCLILSFPPAWLSILSACDKLSLQPALVQQPLSMVTTPYTWPRANWLPVNNFWSPKKGKLSVWSPLSREGNGKTGLGRCLIKSVLSLVTQPQWEVCLHQPSLSNYSNRWVKIKVPLRVMWQSKSMEIWAFFIFGSVFNADFLSGFDLSWDNISAPGAVALAQAEPCAAPAPFRLLPPAWQGWKQARWPWGQWPWSPQWFSVHKGNLLSQWVNRARCPGVLHWHAEVLLVLLPGAASPIMSTPAGSCSSVGCSPSAPEAASDSTAPGLAHP